MWRVTFLSFLLNQTRQFCFHVSTSAELAHSVATSLPKGRRSSSQTEISSTEPCACDATIRTEYKYRAANADSRLRPYHVENIGSRPITEVIQRRARLVL